MSYQVSCNRYHLGLVSSIEKNTVDRGAWWAAVYGVAQSWTRLKQLSMHACTGEGNGNPLRYSYLENTVDRGAWWAAFYGVTQSRTQLKRLSSSRDGKEGRLAEKQMKKCLADRKSVV